jgi:hypothetical protein
MTDEELDALMDAAEDAELRAMTLEAHEANTAVLTRVEAIRQMRRSGDVGRHSQELLTWLLDWHCCIGRGRDRAGWADVSPSRCRGSSAVHLSPDSGSPRR